MNINKPLKLSVTIDVWTHSVCGVLISGSVTMPTSEFKDFATGVFRLQTGMETDLAMLGLHPSTGARILVLLTALGPTVTPQKAYRLILEEVRRILNWAQSCQRAAVGIQELTPLL